MKSNMSAVKFDTGDIQREPICILCSNVTTQGSRLIIHQNEWTINSASKLFNSLPTSWKCEFSSNFVETDVTYMCKSCLRVLEKRDRILTQLQEVNEKITAFLPKKRRRDDDLSSPSKYIALNENEAPSQDFIPRVTSTPVKHVPSSSIKHLFKSEGSRAIYNTDVQVFTLSIIFILLYCTYKNGLT